MRSVAAAIGPPAKVIINTLAKILSQGITGWRLNVV